MHQRDAIHHPYGFRTAEAGPYESVLLTLAAVQLRRGVVLIRWPCSVISQRFYFARLSVLNHWIIFVLYLHNKISYMTGAPIFPSWVLSGISISKILCLY